jgi:hypothetical protein
MRYAGKGLVDGQFSLRGVLPTILEVEQFRQRMRVAAIALGADPRDPRLASVSTGDPMIVEHSDEGVSITYTNDDGFAPVITLRPNGDVEERRADGTLETRIRRR